MLMAKIINDKIKAKGLTVFLKVDNTVRAYRYSSNSLYIDLRLVLTRPKIELRTYKILSVLVTTNQNSHQVLRPRIREVI
jgi:hypothetical protein